MLLNCGVGEDSWDCKNLGLQGNPTSQPKENQSWVFIGRTDVKAETPVLWTLDAKNWPLVKEPDAGGDWGQEKKGTTEDETVGWHYQFDGHEYVITKNQTRLSDRTELRYWCILRVLFQSVLSPIYLTRNHNFHCFTKRILNHTYQY